MDQFLIFMIIIAGIAFLSATVHTIFEYLKSQKR